MAASTRDFLSDVGKCYCQLYADDRVCERIETGISYTDLPTKSYKGMISDVTKTQRHPQIGGFDQWGKPWQLFQLLRRKADKTGHVIHCILITGNYWLSLVNQKEARWLNPEKTSPSRNVPILDRRHGCWRCSLQRSLLSSLIEIEEIRKQFEAAPHKRWLRKVLARSWHLFTEKKPQEALNITQSNSLQEISKTFLSKNKQRTPWRAKLPRSTSTRIVELLVSSSVVGLQTPSPWRCSNGAIAWRPYSRPWLCLGEWD